MGPVKLLMSRREPQAGDTRDEWTYLACCSKPVRHMLQVCIWHWRRGQDAGEAPPHPPRQTSTRSTSRFVCFEPVRAWFDFPEVLGQMRTVRISTTRCRQLQKLSFFFIEEPVKFMFSDHMTTILASSSFLSPLDPHI